MKSLLSMRERLPERAFWPYFIGSLFFSTGFAAYFFLYNIYLAQLGYSETRIGHIAAALSFGSVCGTLPIGFAASRYRIRPTLLVALPLAVFSAVARIFVCSYSLQMLSTFLMGAALCSWGVCLGPSVSALTTERTRPAAFSLLFASGIAMVGVGSILAGHLPTGLQRVFALDAHSATRVTLLLASALPIGTLLFLRPLGVGAIPQTLVSLKRPSGFLRSFLVGIVFWSFGATALSTFAAVYFTKALSVPLPRLGNIFFISQLFQCAGVLAAPLLLRRLSLGACIMTTQVASAVPLALLASSHSASGAALLYWIYISFIYMGEPSLFALLMQRTPVPDRPQASSWHMLVSSLTQSLAAATTGLAISHIGYPAVFLMLAFFGVIAGWLFHQIAKTQFASAM